MSQLNELQLYPLTTIAAPTIGSSVAVATITGDFTIHVRVAALAAGAVVRLSLEESINAFGTSAGTVNMQSFSVYGQIGGPPQGTDVVYSFRQREFAGSFFGQVNAVCRLNITVCSAAGTSVEAWITS